MSTREVPRPVAVVTGGGRGIGASVASTLATSGYAVTITGRDGPRLSATADRIGADAIVADVTEPGAARRVIDRVVGQNGCIDVLVNNAGVSGAGGSFTDGTVDEWWNVLEVNLYGPMAYMHAALGHMVPRSAGTIFNIGSYGGIRPLPWASAYGTSKAALARLTDSVAAVVDGDGVTVLCLSPGLVRTDMTRGVPIFDDVPEDEWDPIDRVGELIVALLRRPDLHRLTGRFLHVRDDLTELFASAEQIRDEGLYQLTMRSLSGPID